MLPTESQQKGLYFEYQCLGATAKEFEVVDDLPRLRNGNKSVDQQRIDTQVIMFKRMVDKYQMDLKYIQKRVEKVWMHNYADAFNEEIVIFGITDAISSIVVQGVKDNEIVDLSASEAVIDLKLTKNIHATFQDGSSWKYPWTRNNTQAYVYKYITGLPFFYFVFDYKPTPERRIYYVEDDPQKTLEMHETIRKTAEEIMKMREEGFPARPFFSICDQCPITDCPARKNQIECQIF